MDQPGAHLGKMEVKGIEVFAHHGVFDFERRDGQLFLIDVTWWADYGRAAIRDDITFTIDYAVVADFVMRLTIGDSFDLIETLAERLAEGLMSTFPMDYIQVAIHKPQAPLTVAFDDVVYTTPIHARPTISRQAVYSLGSNIEPRLDFLQFAVSALTSTPGISGVTVSPVYETAAVGDVEQADFLNAVLIVESSMSAHALLHRGLQIEQLAHRTRDIEHGPRTLDIDLISVGEEAWSHPELILPHPLARTRGFVLVPWLAADPEARLDRTPVRSLVAPDSVSGKRIADQPIHETSLKLFLP